ncbi:cellulose biosynthesis protein BcsP [Caballeronia concitans]|uniref:Cellulose biosynthesis protein BcsR n=1 Tax=Caballeronia concitans TaxID=1777133 RepID=A0A658QWR2_9BURK|nr:cellulose biosynthesis protein BcsP [Caballeronia concitans]KIG06813.1 hypothetical protein BurMR1_0717 [Burkholderia sp. MR1]SAL29384.1 hypothetical protein AWB72_02439 [Caballeronia concitans]
MNTSRDIEKLFDHFGGNAGEYQEIGRENEARSARTRWPLLATLDFAQPAIPEIAKRHDARADAPAPAPHVTQQATPTPIHRGKPPLFARSHRRTVPPVNAPVNALAALDSLSAARFSSQADAAPRAPAPAPQSQQTKPEAPRVDPAPSILGKLFQPAPAAPRASDDSLPALFHRLRNGGPRS